MKNLQELRENVDFGLITNAEYLRSVVEYLDEHDPNRAASVVAAMNQVLASLVDTWEELPFKEENEHEAWVRTHEAWINTPDYVKADLGLI